MGFRKGWSCFSILLEFFEAVAAKEDKGYPVAIICFDLSENNLQCSVLEVNIKAQSHVISGKLAKWQETNGVIKQNIFYLESTHQQGCGSIGLWVPGFPAYMSNLLYYSAPVKGNQSNVQKLNFLDLDLEILDFQCEKKGSQHIFLSVNLSNTLKHAKEISLGPKL